jgi:hypothetical protein
MKAALLALLLTALPCLAENLVLVDGTVTQRYYPNPNLKLITHLVIATKDGSYLVMDHPGFSNIAEGEKIKCAIVKGSVYEKTGQRIWYYVSDSEPTQADKDATKARVMQRYREEITF